MTMALTCQARYLQLMLSQDLALMLSQDLAGIHNWNYTASHFVEPVGYAHLALHAVVPFFSSTRLHKDYYYYIITFVEMTD